MTSVFTNLNLINLYNDVFKLKAVAQLPRTNIGWLYIKIWIEGTELGFVKNHNIMNRIFFKISKLLILFLLYLIVMHFEFESTHYIV